MQIVSGLIAGLLFGLGLIVSGMVNPAKVINFLDIFGTWDPSLAFVMGGAIIVALPGFVLISTSAKPLFSETFQLPTGRHFDARLLSGAALFGIGWGLGGFCPGPSITAIPLMAQGTFVFVPTMLVGMWLAKFVTSQLGT